MPRRWAGRRSSHGLLEVQGATGRTDSRTICDIQRHAQPVCRELAAVSRAQSTSTLTFWRTGSVLLVRAAAELAELSLAGVVSVLVRVAAELAELSLAGVVSVLVRVAAELA